MEEEKEYIIYMSYRVEDVALFTREDSNDAPENLKCPKYTRGGGGFLFCVSIYL